MGQKHKGDSPSSEQEESTRELNTDEKLCLREAEKIIRYMGPGSVRYQIGDALIHAVRSVKQMAKLPITLYRIYKNASDSAPQQIPPAQFSFVRPIDQARKTIVFAPTNGAGLGHLTRLLAIARRVKQLSPETEIIFFSTSSAMHLILQEGFLGYHLPANMLFPSAMKAEQWNLLLQDQLGTMLNVHQPDMLVFDGASPYAGLIATMANKHDMKKVWIKRGQHKSGKAELVQRKEHYFDQVIVPGEAGQELPPAEEKKTHVPPVLFLDHSELSERETVRMQWNIPEDAVLVYVQLGSGNISDIGSLSGMVLNELLKRDNVYVVLGESIIGKRLNVRHERVMPLRDYPNSLYAHGFDLAITATGYNTFHEMMHFGVPSLFLPNEATETDDQAARARIAEAYGAAVVVYKPTPDAIAHALDTALDPHHRENMRNAARALVSENGGDHIARKLLDMV